MKGKGWKRWKKKATKLQKIGSKLCVWFPHTVDHLPTVKSKLPAATWPKLTNTCAHKVIRYQRTAPIIIIIT